MTDRLTHIDSAGRAVMVDVSNKPKIKRTAVAAGSIELKPETLSLIAAGAVKKGDVLAAARIAGIAAAKKTWDLIPLCHNIAIDHVSIELEPDESGIKIIATTVCTDKTGIEMEALAAVSVAGLTIYDMCKAVDKEMRITDIRLIEKTKETR